MAASNYKAFIAEKVEAEAEESFLASLGEERVLPISHRATEVRKKPLCTLDDDNDEGTHLLATLIMCPGC
jgi:hypothetical protein